MAPLTERELKVLKALGELEPASVDALVKRTGLPRAEVVQFLEKLEEMLLLYSFDKSDSSERQQ